MGQQAAKHIRLLHSRKSGGVAYRTLLSVKLHPFILLQVQKHQQQSESRGEETDERAMYTTRFIWRDVLDHHSFVKVGAANSASTLFLHNMRILFPVTVGQR